MIYIKPIVTYIILFSLTLSMFGGIVPATATESPDVLPEDEVQIELSINEDDINNNPYNEAEEEDVGESIVTPAAQSATSDPIVEFVKRMYTEALKRDAEPEGLHIWSETLRARRIDGSTVAHGFFFSQEIIDKNISNEEFVIRLYKTLMDRDPWPEEITGWAAHLYNGYPREDIFSFFVNAPEFVVVCNDYGILRGAYVPPRGGEIRVFVTRLYRLALGRSPDPIGLDAHTNALLAGRTGAAAAYEFMFSEEIINEELSNENFVIRLYKTLMDRDPWPEEITGWAAHLYNGYPREDVFAGFSNSDEFYRVCTAAGIIRGSYTPPPGGLIHVFINNMFKSTHGRSPSAVEQNHWFHVLSNKSATGFSFAQYLIFGNEMTAKDLKNDQFIDMLFLALLDKPSSDPVRSIWINALNNGTATKQSAFISFTQLVEFDNLCKDHGVITGSASQPGGGGSGGSGGGSGGGGGTGPLGGRVVVLDPGHGTSGSPGAPGYIEAVAMLSLARRIRTLLEEQGYNVALTRDNESNPSLAARCAHINIIALEEIRWTRTDINDINEINRLIGLMQGIIRSPNAEGGRLMNYPWSTATRIHPDLQRVFEYQNDPVIRNNFLVVSLHSNAVGAGASTAARGAEAWYIDPTATVNVRNYYTGYSHASRSRHFGDIILNHINSAGIPRRSDGLRASNMMISRETNVPSVLVENGFHTNPSDLALLRSPAFMESLAVAYRNAIMQYFG